MLVINMFFFPQSQLSKLQMHILSILLILTSARGYGKHAQFEVWYAMFFKHNIDNILISIASKIPICKLKLFTQGHTDTPLCQRFYCQSEEDQVWLYLFYSHPFWSHY